MNKAFSDRLRTSIRANGYSTVTKFSKACKVDSNQINRYICGRVVPTYKPLCKMVEFLPKTDIRWLITGQNHGSKL